MILRVRSCFRACFRACNMCVMRRNKNVVWAGELTDLDYPCFQSLEHYSSQCDYGLEHESVALHIGHHDTYLSARCYGIRHKSPDSWTDVLSHRYIHNNHVTQRCWCILPFVAEYRSRYSVFDGTMIVFHHVLMSFQGITSMSDYSVSFHNIPLRRMYEMEFLVYHLRPYGIRPGLQRLNPVLNTSVAIQSND